MEYDKAKLEPLSGFSDRTGKDLRVRGFVERTAAQVLEENGFEEFSPPLIERADTYAAIVGIEPTFWSVGVTEIPTLQDTFQRDLFPIEVRDFRNGKMIESIDAVLLPEGTASIARYIGNCLSSGTKPKTKVYYVTECFRNEDLDKLCGSRKRSFGQIGAEYIGDASAAADAEVVLAACRVMTELGIPKSAISARFSDVRIFQNLINESRLDQDTMVKMKALVENYSKAKASGERVEYTRRIVMNRIQWLSKQLPKFCSERWKNMIESTREADFPEAESLYKVRGALESYGFSAIFDPAMIRGWKYYTGPICQIDVKGDRGNMIEIAGGGRYDNLIGDFVKKCGINATIPATGFAFGTERLATVVSTYAVIPESYSVKFRIR